MAREGKIRSKTVMAAHPFDECFIAKEAKKLKSDRNDSFQDPQAETEEESDLQGHQLCSGW